MREHLEQLREKGEGLPDETAKILEEHLAEEEENSAKICDTTSNEVGFLFDIRLLVFLFFLKLFANSFCNNFIKKPLFSVLSYFFFIIFVRFVWLSCRNYEFTVRFVSQGQGVYRL